MRGLSCHRMGFSGPNLRLTPELGNPINVFVRADTMELHLEWSAARERSLAGEHRLTTAVRSSMSGPAVPC